MITHLKYLSDNIRTKLFDIIYEEQLRSPKGGVKIKGKFFPGGQFIPTDGGYAKEFKKMKSSNKNGLSTSKTNKKSTHRVATFDELKKIQNNFRKKTPMENKKNVVASLSKKMKLKSKIVNDHVRYWAQTSADNNPESLGIQFLARDIFNTGKTSHLNKKIAKSDDVKKKFIKTVYSETQDWFKKQGFKPNDKVLLYRGVRNKVKSGKYALQPLSSFSFSKEVARAFAEDAPGKGTVFAVKVPIKNIFSTPLTGIGCTDELEAVVVGNDININVAHKVKIKDKNDFKTKSIGEFDDIVIGPKIASLEGSPKKINGYFNCSQNNSLITLKGAPKTISGNFICVGNNKLASLEGGPKEIGGDFKCSNNQRLTSLKGAPEKIDGDFQCTFNYNLTSLEGCPKEVGGDFICSPPITEEQIRKVCKVKGKIFIS